MESQLTDEGIEDISSDEKMYNRGDRMFERYKVAMTTVHTDRPFGVRPGVLWAAPSLQSSATSITEEEQEETSDYTDGTSRPAKRARIDDDANIMAATPETLSAIMRHMKERIDSRRGSGVKSFRAVADSQDEEGSEGSGVDEYMSGAIDGGVLAAEESGEDADAEGESDSEEEEMEDIDNDDPNDKDFR